MPIITLPDGSLKTYNSTVTPLKIAEDISNSLKKSSVIAKVNGEYWDLSREILEDSKVAIIKKGDPETIDIIRHDCAHILAEAVLEIFPETQVTIGPVIENGFYYDFYRKTPFTTEDLTIIEKRMHEIVNRNESINREVLSRDDALKFYEDKNEPFKVELIRDIPNDQQLTFYKQGLFTDLCRGPHLRSTHDTGHAFKLMSVAGAYWRGDSTKPMLTRIYGTAWNTRKELEAYINQLAEAEKRDHRKLGKEMRLFHFQDEAPGMVFWHPSGWTIYSELQNYVRKMQRNAEYLEINTPQVVDRKLWEKSGHWDKYRENMFITEIDEEHANEKRVNALKPMNCPCHVQVYNQDIKSYRDLPYRLAEFGSCHRYEPSGTMHGLMRVRGFTQDDGHIFCTEDQIESETGLFIDLLSNIYSDLGFNTFKIKLSTRPEVRVGTDKVWDKAEIALKKAIENLKLQYEIDEGDGAFYGPKIDFVLTDALGRDWQCGTWQLDFNLPERLEASYVGKDGNKHIPVMMHRAILGSFERFIGILIENYGGNLPLWLAPNQVVLATITDDAKEYAQSISDELNEQGIRCLLDLRNEKISYKIREHSVSKNPIILALGKKEVEDKTVSIRRLGSEKTETIELNKFIKSIKQEVKTPLQK